ncbi:uncharacterized protein K452DRAFT_321748 [Aplosporella prunicola CBS 121167]|uniref:Uncharacterized protein n=1 Tax=Aplosporella prunicola CBS 121167 TaxID=1176127 RepID=A0A6A6B012_9PEZI|nr:uncharacterized protein K452DRAFT_321748 [Aplosporella prunicola CBS 121167]KAF2137509.1 hypothetical protein K452DRAFT_321748 [Aplosporella prunicola CBS 121167]
MPSDDSGPANNQSQPQRPDQQPEGKSIFRTLTTIPPPVKRLFNKFPLVVYAANELPARSPRARHQHALYIFATPDGAVRGHPSFNPGCLKWQAYLTFCDIEFRVVASSNHASPTGALPFLLPSGTHATLIDQPQVIPSNKLQKWAMEQTPAAMDDPDDHRFEAYMSLLDNNIRRAWLYTVYLTSNFETIAEPLYTATTSSNPIVQATIARQLRAAAEAELLKYGAVIDGEAIYSEAEEAFRALEIALGSDRFFFGAEKPGLFDASVFAYTHLLLQDLGHGWKESRLGNAVRVRQKLVRHQERLTDLFFVHEGRMAAGAADK